MKKILTISMILIAAFALVGNVYATTITNYAGITPNNSGVIPPSGGSCADGAGCDGNGLAGSLSWTALMGPTNTEISVAPTVTVNPPSGFNTPGDIIWSIQHNGPVTPYDYWNQTTVAWDPGTVTWPAFGFSLGGSVGVADVSRILLFAGDATDSWSWTPDGATAYVGFGAGSLIYDSLAGVYPPTTAMGSFLASGDTVKLRVLSFGTINGGSYDLKFSAVPEPATMMLLGLGMIGIAGVRRKLS